MPRQSREIWDAFWRDRNGRIVIWQTPNVFLIGWAVITLISLFSSSKSLANALSLIGAILLVVWSLLEMFRGVNYFRRLVGLVVLVLMIVFLIKTV